LQARQRLIADRRIRGRSAQYPPLGQSSHASQPVVSDGSPRPPSRQWSGRDVSDRPHRPRSSPRLAPDNPRVSGPWCVCVAATTSASCGCSLLYDSLDLLHPGVAARPMRSTAASTTVVCKSLSASARTNNSSCTDSARRLCPKPAK
jgi:hypothetical protein